MSEEETPRRTEMFVVIAGLTPWGEEIELRIPYPVSPGLSKVYAALKPLLASGDLHLEFLDMEQTRPLYRSVEPFDKYEDKDDGFMSAEELALTVAEAENETLH